MSKRRKTASASSSPKKSSASSPKPSDQESPPTTDVDNVSAEKRKDYEELVQAVSRIQRNYRRHLFFQKLKNLVKLRQVKSVPKPKAQSAASVGSNREAARRKVNKSASEALKAMGPRGIPGFWDEPKAEKGGVFFFGEEKVIHDHKGEAIAHLYQGMRVGDRCFIKGGQVDTPRTKRVCNGLGWKPIKNNRHTLGTKGGDEIVAKPFVRIWTQHNRRGDRFEEVNPARFQADDTALLIPKLTDTSTLSLNQTYLNAWISDLQQPPPQKPPPTVRRRPRPRPRPNPTTPQSQKPKSDSPNGPTKRKRKLSPYMNFYRAIYNTVSTKIAGELTPTDNVAVCSAKKCGQVLCLFFSLFVVVAVEGKAYQDGLGRLRKDGCSCFAV